ncbi:hypothetical protein ACFW1A_14245 [Kitasatospora sp. NPDC058965]|uniref:hypothetical protein n=1 Tax=Kitasatospora sp. NPDC058965 TaxID=3346682 RepID=UPI0036CB0BFD
MASAAFAAIERARDVATLMDNWIAAEDPQQAILKQAKEGWEAGLMAGQAVEQFTAACRAALHPDSRVPFRRV